MRPGFSLVIVLLGLHPAVERQAGSSRILEEILLVEDRRAQGENDLSILTGALAHADPLVVRHAARAIGRLERPGVAWHLFPLLLSPFPAVRSTAMEAIAQAAQGFRGDSSRDSRGATWPALHACVHVWEWISHGLPSDPHILISTGIGVIVVSFLSFALAWMLARQEGVV